MCRGGSRRGGVSRGQAVERFVVGGSKWEGQRGQRCVARRLQSGDGRELSASGSPSPVLGAIPSARPPGGDGGSQRHGLLWGQAAAGQ